MKSHQKGSILSKVLIIIVLALIAIVGLIYMTSSSLDQARKESSLPTTNNTLTAQAGWVQFANTGLGISLSHPSDWTAKVDEPGVLTLVAPQNNIDGRDGNMIIASSLKIVADTSNQGKITEALKKDIDQNVNTVVSGVNAVKKTKIDTEYAYSVNIDFVANDRYYIIIQNWSVSGVLDDISPAIKIDAVKILDQITKTILISE